MTNASSRYSCISAMLFVVLLTATASARSRHTTGNSELELPSKATVDWVDDGTKERLVSTVQRILGKEAGNYIALDPEWGDQRDLIATQFTVAFARMPAPMLPLPDGRMLFTGSVPHDATEKAFVVTESDSSTVVAVALLHQSCFAAKCPPRPVLTFFVSPGNALSSQVRDDVIRWVKKYEHDNNEAFRHASDAVRKASIVQAFEVNVRVLNRSLSGSAR